MKLLCLSQTSHWWTSNGCQEIQEKSCPISVTTLTMGARETYKILLLRLVHPSHWYREVKTGCDGLGLYNLFMSSITVSLSKTWRLTKKNSTASNCSWSKTGRRLSLMLRLALSLFFSSRPYSTALLQKRKLIQLLQRSDSLSSDTSLSTCSLKTIEDQLLKRLSLPSSNRR